MKWRWNWNAGGGYVTLWRKSNERNKPYLIDGPNEEFDGSDEEMLDRLFSLYSEPWNDDPVNVYFHEHLVSKRFFKLIKKDSRFKIQDTDIY